MFWFIHPTNIYWESSLRQILYLWRHISQGDRQINNQLPHAKIGTVILIEISRVRKKVQRINDKLSAEAEGAQRAGKMGSMKNVNIRDVPTHKLSERIQSKCKWSKDLSTGWPDVLFETEWNTMVLSHSKQYVSPITLLTPSETRLTTCSI